MEFEILKNPMSILEVTLKKDEIIIAEAGALVFMKDIQIDTKMRTEILDSQDIAFVKRIIFC
jgi:uncharacterized protein (AIM24 family)